MLFNYLKVSYRNLQQAKSNYKLVSVSEQAVLNIALSLTLKIEFRGAKCVGVFCCCCFLCQTDEHKHEMDPIAQFVEHKAG